MHGTPTDKKAARGARPLALSLTLACAALAPGCPGDQRPDAVSLRLTRGGAAVADEEVELRFENPPGGIIRLRADAEGRVAVPSKYKGLRFQVGTDCPQPGQCHRYYAPSKLDGDDLAVELTGGVNYGSASREP